MAQRVKNLPAAWETWVQSLPEVKEGLKPIIENLKEQGLLVPCSSPCNTPILGIKKSNGKWRLVQDLRIINEAA